MRSSALVFLAAAGSTLEPARGQSQDAAPHTHDLWLDLLSGDLGQRLKAGQEIALPLAVPKELAASLELTLQGRGAGVSLELRGSGPGRILLTPTSDRGAVSGIDVVLDAARLERELGRAPYGRLTARIQSGEGGSWPTLRASVVLPSVSPEELEREISRHLDEIFACWLERGLDRKGPRETALACQVFDVVTGEPLFTVAGGLLPLWGFMFSTAHATGETRWDAAIEAFLADFFELCLDPSTGLPREWDCEFDVPRRDSAVEVAPWLRFLLDLSERGPVAWRARALAAAEKMGATILERGVLPDGTMAAIFISSTGTAGGAPPEIRRLNTPSELARLSRLTERPEFVAAARRAIAEFEFTLHWGGSTQRIDPDFDDSFGTLGAALTTLLEAHPEDPLARRMLREGWNHFLPLWEGALREGGSVAADQVRCWDMAARYGRQAQAGEPRPERMIELAANMHLIGELYETGVWGDLTHLGWQPQSGLSVGDLTGMPANLLWGLALLCDPTLVPGETPQRTEERCAKARAWFALVLRSIDETYKRPYGYLLTRTQLAGANRCGAELRLCQGLVTALRSLAKH